MTGRPLAETKVNWTLLKQLRKEFLSEEKSARSYWTQEALEQYDLTFARRIGWKWESVLKEVSRLGWVPPSEYEILDWGCGTGVATETFLGTFAQKPVGISFHDSTSLAIHFSKEKMRRLFPDVPHETTGKPRVLLLSHVLNELTPRHLNDVLALCETAHTVFWVEPGTKEASRELIQVRKKVQGRKHIWAPCPHQGTCGLEKSEKDWCHHFADVPNEVFQSSWWNEFSANMKIDVRSLPVSYLAASQASRAYSELYRVVGSPRLYKGNGKFDLCSEGNVEERTLQRSKHKVLFEHYKKRKFATRINAEFEIVES